jgi:CubicO group peptidase (beta-lactamase class C family)
MNFKSSVISFSGFLCLLPFVLTNVKEISNTRELIEAIQKKYREKEPKYISLGQIAVNYKNDSVIYRGKEYMVSEFPNIYRIYFGSDTSSNSDLSRNDTVYSFRKGKMVGKGFNKSSVLILTGGWDFIPLDSVLSKLDYYGYNVSKFREDTWEGRKVYVVGSNDKNDLTSSQFWIDAERLYLVRSIDQYSPKTSLEIRYAKFIELGGGLTETSVLYILNGHKYRTEDYFDIRVLPDVDEKVFDPTSLSNSRQTISDLNGIVIDNDTCRKIDEYLTGLQNKANFSGGLLIIKDGKKNFNKGYGLADKENKIPFTPSTLASMGSITKAFTAAAIMKLMEQGKLSVDAPLKTFFPNIPADKQNITIQQLLTHSAGFPEFLKNDQGDYEKNDKAEFLKKAFSDSLIFKPGEKAIYSNVDMSILAIILEQVSGLDYEAYLEKYLFEPIGIKQIGYHYPTKANENIAIGYQDGKLWGTHPQHFREAGGGPYWNLKGNGGLEVSLNEMYIWANAITNHTVLRASSIQKMFTPYIKEEGHNGESSFGYGCNISKSRRNTELIDNGGSNGVYFARLIRLPEEGLVFYMVTNESSINTNMVLPNVTQLYFSGKISQDATALMQQKPETEMSKRIYDILEKPTTKDLKSELEKENITIDDDMILLNVGQTLISEKKADEALMLYQYYTTNFPNIVVAWNDLGDLYLMKNNKNEAIRCYQQALKIRPANQRAKENLEKLMKQN